MLKRNSNAECALKIYTPINNTNHIINLLINGSKPKEPVKNNSNRIFFFF